MKRIFFTLACLSLLFDVTTAQLSTIINTGTAGTPAYNAGPIYRSSAGSAYDASRYSYLYTQSELAAAGITPGSFISELGWVKNNAATTTGGGIFRIYMKNSSATAFSGATETWANLNTGATLVYENLSQQVPDSVTPAYIMFTLITPFLYTGGSLEISPEWDINQVSGSPSTGTFDWLWSTVADRIYGTGNTTLAPITSLSSTTNSISDITDRRPFIKIVYSGGVALDGALTQFTAPTTLCPGLSDVIVRFANYGTDTITDAKINWSVNGVAQTPYYYAGSLSPLANVDLTLGNYSFSSGTAYNIQAVIDSVNGTIDGSAFDDTVNLTGVKTGLTGNYTIDSAVVTGGSNYQSFTDFASDLTSYGVCGPVVANVVTLSGPYNQQVILTPVLGASSVNTITINGNGELLTFSSANTNERATIKLNGADHVTINNLSIGATGTYGFGVQLLNNADSNTISNCSIDIGNSSTSTNYAGIVISNSATSATGTGASNCDNNLITGNTVLGGYYGITLVANGSTNVISGNEVSNNTVQDFYQYGIYLNGNSGTLIENNNISRPVRSNPTTFYGVYFTSASENCVVSKNRIHNPFDGNTASTSAAYGLYFISCDATLGNENVVVNNLVYSFNGNGNHNGIFNNGSNYVNHYHNTIVLDDANSSCTTCGTRGFYHQTAAAAGLEFKNNLISITRAGGGESQGLYFDVAGSFIADYNNYYINGAGLNEIGHYSGTGYATLALWESGVLNDSNSLAVIPQFTNPGNGNFTPTSSSLNDMGVPVGVNDDINNLTRNLATPDIGALEFDVAATDAGINGITVTNCAGTDSVYVTVQNFGAATINSVVVYCLVDGNPTANSGNTFAVNIPASGSTILSMGTATFTTGNLYTVTAFTALPNGSPDANNPNDTSSITVNLALTGTYTINSALATSGTNFQSFSAAESALNAYGVCGPVVINVVSGSGPYNEQIEFNQINGASAINTITINGNGETLTFDPTSTLKYVLRMNGSDYFTIDSLKIVGINAAYGFGILLSNNADFNTIRNCEIDLSAVTSTTSTNSCGICISASVTSPATIGNNGSFNQISNNLIKGGSTGGPYYGISLYGNTGAVGCSGNIVIGNRIRDFYNNGIRLNLSSACEIIGNDLSRPNLIAAGTLEGIYLTGTTNPKTKIIKNRIHNSHGANPTSTSAVYAIDVTSDGGGATQEILVANNAIYNINHNGSAYPIYISGSLYSNYYHNSISLDNTSATGTSTGTRGIYLLGTCDSINIKNNVISLTRGGTAAMYGLYYTTLPANLKSDFNDVYVNAASPASYFGYNGSPQLTLADWLATSFRDSSSANIDPLYASAVTGDLTPAASGINDFGENLTVVVPDDILGVTRTSTPDPGAFEFTPSLDDAGVTSINSPVCTGTDTVFVTLQNFGAATLTSVNIYASANGTPTPNSGNIFAVNLLPGQDTVLNLGAVTYTAGVVYDLIAYSSQPNASTDANNLNDTATLQVNLGLNGNYTINSAAATSGTNFQTFTDVAAALNSYGLCGPVVFTVTPGSGPYVNQQITLNQITGSSATNTITIKGNNEVFSFLSANTNVRAGIKLNGTDYTTIDSLVIIAQATATTEYGWGVQLTAAATHNTISHNYIFIDTLSTATTNYAGIVMTGSNTSLTSVGNNGNYNTFENNIIRGGFHGITLVGPSTTLYNYGNVIRNNSITQYHSSAVNSDNQDTMRVEENTVAQRIGGATTGYGLNLGYSAHTLVRKNRVVTRGSSTNYGIYTNNGYSSPDFYTEISNNFVTCLGGTGTTYGIYSFNAYCANIYHNSVNVTGGSATAGRAIYLNSSTTGNYGFVNVINNIGLNAGPGYAVEISSAAANLGYVTSMQNNDWFANGTVLGRYNNINSGSLSAWTAASSFDSSSISIDPVFVSADDLHASSPFLNDRGALALGVSDDIDGEIRCPNIGCAGSTLRPDIGADEFLGAPITVDMGSDILVAPAQSACFTSAETVTLQIKNYNTQLIDFSLYPVTVYASVSGTNPVTFTPLLIDTGTLNPDSTLLVTFSTSYDMSVPGTYTYSFYVSQSSDANLANDSLLNENIEFNVGTIANEFAEICSGSSFELKMDGITGPVQWQSYDNINTIWVNETGPGSDSVAYAVSPTTTTLYRALVCSTYPSATDTLVPITVAPPVVINDTICNGQTANLIAIGSGDKVWYTSLTGGTSLFTGDTLAVPVTSDTTFYVENIQALTGGTGSLKITEIDVDNTTDKIEIQNLSAQALNTAGWVVAISSSYTAINTVNATLWALPATIAPGQILFKTDATGANYWGSNILWNPSQQGWAMIIDNNGVIRDLVVMNWPASALPTFSALINGFNITLGPNDWVGNGVDVNTIPGGTTINRVGNSDNNDASDFMRATLSMNVQNSGLSSSFVGGSCSSTRVPASIKVEPSPVVSLGTDTTQCEGTITLSAGNPGNAYLWSTTDVTQTITVDTSGTYSVTVTSPNGCTNNDAVNVNIAPFPIANLGPDVTQCGGLVILSTSNLSNNFTWSTGSTDPFITVLNSGTYSVTVTTPAGCASLDTVDIAINSVPVVTLREDTAQCGGSVTLDAANAGSIYAWSNGESTQIISANLTANYIVTVTDANNCTASDSVSIAINPFPVVNLGADTAQCEGTITLDAANTGSSYLWSTNAATQSITVDTSGTYYVVVTGSGGCASSDTVNLTINANPAVTFSIVDSICLNETPISLGGNPSGGIFSGNGVTGNSFNPTSAGVGVKTITYTYTDNNGCLASASDDIEVVVCVGIDEIGDNIFITVYPNPSTGVVYIQMSSLPQNEVVLEVFSSDGKLIQSVNKLELSNTLNLTNVATGIYTFRITTSGYSAVKRVVIE